MSLPRGLGQFAAGGERLRPGFISRCSREGDRPGGVPGGEGRGERALEHDGGGKELEAVIAVFVAAPDFAANRANKAAVKEFLTKVRKKLDVVVWEPPASWDPDEADALTAEVGALAARDPLAHGTTKNPIAYYRLPGPAGHKSRYEDPAIEKLGELARKSKNKEATYVFTNVDMFADAKRLKKAAKV